MPLVVNTNMGSINAQRHLNNNTNALQKSMEKLSSGFRINRASDDAAGLALSETLRTQIRGSQKALSNAQDGINVLNLADGAMQQIEDNFQRMRELAVQAGNDTYSGTQRTAMQSEFNQLATDNTRIINATSFNGQSVFGATMVLQVGANGVAANDTINATTALTAPTAGVNAAWATSAAARTSIATVDGYIDTLNSARGTLGAYVNQLESASNNLSIAVENYSSAESRIRNVDVAQESANLSRNQILQQASQAMLAQANQAPQLALQLLKG
jgi:flagellin